MLEVRKMLKRPLVPSYLEFSRLYQVKQGFWKKMVFILLNCY